jgi:hypothetical protein
MNSPHTLIIISLVDKKNHSEIGVHQSSAFSSKVISWASAVILILLTACTQQSNTTPLPYTDDFSNTASGWQTLSDTSADVKYDGGALRFLIKQENLTQWSVAGKTFQDGVVEVDAQPNGGPTDNGFGMILRVKDRKNFYHFEVSSDGYWRAGIVQNGDWHNWDDWAASSAVKVSNAQNHLKVIMKGDTFTFFVNDEQVFQKQDKTYAVGDIGLFALSLIDRPGTDISFDNVKVTPVQNTK